MPMEEKPVKTKGSKKVLSAGVNSRYFKNRLRDVNLSLRGLGKLMALDPTELVRGFKGERWFRAYEIVQLCQHLDAPMDEVLKNLGIEVPKTVKYKK